MDELNNLGNEYEVIIYAFVAACKYLQTHGPSYVETIEEIKACAGVNTYEDGWMQWANYFINQVNESLKEKKGE